MVCFFFFPFHFGSDAVRLTATGAHHQAIIVRGIVIIVQTQPDVPESGESVRCLLYCSWNEEGCVSAE